jgi:hypothetical protein
MISADLSLALDWVSDSFPCKYENMIELEVYARGLRKEQHILELTNQMAMLPKVRYKIDQHHDLVYFEIDDPRDVSLRQLNDLFTHIGLIPRFVGHLPENLRRGDETTRLTE